VKYTKETIIEMEKRNCQEDDPPGEIVLGEPYKIVISEGLETYIKIDEHNVDAVSTTTIAPWKYIPGEYDGGGGGEGPVYWDL
jgi:hypothetical protein